MSKSLVRMNPIADNKAPELRSWGLVELFGHQRIGRSQGPSGIACLSVGDTLDGA